MVPSVTLPNKICRNLFSALKHSDSVKELIDTECKNGCLYGPFDQPPFKHYRVSPLGVAVGKYSGKKRLIVDLSSPHDDLRHVSINDLLDKDSCSLTYVRIDDAINAIKKCGKGALLTKHDISNAFKVIPIRPDQWPYFCVKWDKKFYVFVRLVFGCRSSPCIFDTLSQAICWIASTNYGVETIFHLLDDFLSVDSPDACTGERTMAILSLVFNRLKIPLAKHKCIGPATCLEYLGIILDSIKMEARLPLEKVQRILEFIDFFIEKRHCTKREILQLLGHFNFASRVILPGRSFVSHLLNIAVSVRDLHQKVKLDEHCFEDLLMWRKFLQDWNGVSLFYEKDFTTNFDMQLFSDASLIGFGSIFGTQWLYSTWPTQLPAIADGDLSMAFRELYPIVAAAIVWGKYWKTKRILFMCDNQATVRIIQKARSRCLAIMRLMRTLTWTAAVNNFHFSARFLPGSTNLAADSLSRLLFQKFRMVAPYADPYPQTCPTPETILWK